MDMPTQSETFSTAAGGWETERLYDSARQHFDSMLAGIENAQKSVALAVYIFEPDGIGWEFVDHLQRAAQRGVRVRVLVDGVGSAHFAHGLGELLTGVGAEFHIYHPLPWYLGNYRWSLNEGSWLQKFWYFLGVANRRDHRKFMVVDDTHAWCGNLNISDEHLGRRQPWRDYGVAVEGMAVRTLLANFDAVWTSHRGNSELGDFQLCCSNLSFRNRWLRNRNLAARIRYAKQRVWICSAYFSPSGPILRAIRAACKRGIDVRVIVAGRSDVPFFPLLTSSYYADLLKMGVRVYQYERGVLHAKVILADQQCIVGSTNLNHRSFYHDLELDVVLSQPLSIERMQRLLLTDMSTSHVVSRGDISLLSRSFWFSWLPRLLRYWM